MARALLILLAVSLAACSATSRWFGGGPGGGPAQDERPGPAPASPALDARGLGGYLELMRRLIEGDSLLQAESFRDVEEAADYAPTTTNRLKYALALAVPGHPGSNAALAEQRLSALLSASQALLPEEQVLATIHLRDVEQRLILDALAEQLLRDAAAAAEQSNTESARRLQTALEENRRLRAELDDATQKLNALTTIEQSIRERENGAN
jgi:hypothetical protein